MVANKVRVKIGPRKLLSGRRFGRLLVLSIGARRKNGYLWFCQCDCGSTASVLSGRLLSGKTQSCGCLRRERASRARFIHGKTNSTTYNTWHGMKTRCHNPASSGFRYYGGRGIRVCDRWRNSFQNFLADMGECPDGRSLDRIDNDKGYSPENCRWATRREQAVNARSNVNLLFNGESLCVSEWARRMGCKVATIYQRLRRNWPIERILAAPVRKLRHP